MTGKRGRPRNVEAQKSILSASYDLLLENGFEAVTVDKIADRAQVSKATIYKWWPNKAAVVMDGFLYAATARLPVPDTGSTFQDIQIHATNLARFLTSREGTIITELLGEGQFDSGLAEAYRARFFRPRRLEARGILEKGVQRGELKKNLDIDICIDLLYGPIFYRLLVTGDTLDESYVQSLVANAFEGIRST
ncbi:TetR/AcrR family transcriptional regulator [Paenibacillus alvei]|uniref:TetR/AcrR family transcriptional regulator n=1 Tax=Paenibacillus alvei TaxID=44250 RepID=A0ABT4GRC8_PAEAL|nr:TetR/AcrR family transcriptional regulator [Paenibacillus alvei]MCY9539918.1 TetR/AcrR family transcriptional regulator [Paenibacillus alvei]MCY9707186.1 TetR/AcrR family transcriptional regulator [Paenibacillus alvei]MCY9733345.1 TetR/AcrR family transcriptional regulator [Paenibacillus alvei]MCY9753204.1 TetR/AcrR family transcriptional regulator [Paenibacillus alvei]MCY9759254.1 TetR/AcrR family transcriptional regulator [Paenibacillus alvei]